MSAIAVTSIEFGPVTIPLASIKVVRQAKDRTAIVVFQNGNELETKDQYRDVSERMVSTRVWGSVSTEAA